MSPPPSPHLQSQGSMNMLSQQFRAQTLSQHPPRSTAVDLPTPPPELDFSQEAGITFTNPAFKAPAFSDTSCSSPIPSPETAPRSLSSQLPYSNYHIHNIRRSRQDAIRRQCSTSHLKEISQLVARMVESEEQCTICSKGQQLATAMGDAAHEDESMEGADEDERPSTSDSNEASRTSLGRTITGQSMASSKSGVSKHKQRPGARRRATTRK